jgi:predicted CXXCH cytochrome family protein
VPSDAPIPAASYPRRWRLWLAGAAILALAIVAALVVRWRSPPAEPFPLAPIAESPFLNTQPNAHYVGSDKCVKCHEQEHASFRHTGMGRSMATVDTAHEPPDGALDHPVSKRRYDVQRKNGELWHRELLLAGGAESVVLAEYPVKHVVGSGRHARTYLVEADGFLVESPVTWYPSRHAWDVSPGYDDPKQPGFARPVGEGCLMCHAGQAEAVAGSLHKVKVTEPAIGCERCHGPGSLHVDRHQQPPAGGRVADTAIDYTIVNPMHLSRDLAEAICQQCHLNSHAVVTLRGRKLADFRPGQHWGDYRQVYVLEGTGESMTVVGHVEQMHLSKCYQSSSTLTCLTCHDPHDEPQPAQRVGYYRDICTRCHESKSCTVDPARRRKESPDNDCVHCHMPRSATDIPHLAFTHHRIGKHGPPTAASEVGRLPELRPFLDESALSAVDRKLAMGHAYRAFANREKDPERATHYREQAFELLSEVYTVGLRDAELEAGLAQLRFDLKLGDALPLAQSALAHPDLTGQGRVDALFVSAQELGRHGKHADAVDALRELTHLRRYVFDWLFIGDYSKALGDGRASLEAYEMAVRINPRQANAHRYLADQYRQLGDTERAAWHQKRAVP